MCLSAMTAGCATIPGINKAMRKVDRAWQLDYQKMEDDVRHRVIDAPYPFVYSQVRKTFLDLSMPVKSEDPEKGIIITENNAPHPLTPEEWRRVVKEENPRVRRLSGSVIFLADNPDDYIVTMLASMRAVDGKTFVLLNYELDAPAYRQLGVEPTKHAPPLAVKIFSMKFWDLLHANLKKVNAPVPRKRNPDELYATSGGEIFSRYQPAVDNETKS